MPAEHLAGPIDHSPAAKLVFVGVGCNQLFVVAEANILALRPLSRGQSKPARAFTHLCLLHLAEWKNRVRQLLLRQREQKIGLILAAVGAAQQRRALRSIVAHHSSIVSGGDVVSALLLSPSKQRADLKVAVARHARIRRAAVEIIPSERFYHRLGKLAAQVEQRVRNAKMLGNFSGAAVI